MSGRIIEKEDQEYINQFLSDNHQEELFRGWVSITSSTIQGVRERLVFVTTFRFQVVKQGFTGRSLKPSLSFLDLKEIEYIDSSTDGTIPPGLRLKFADDEVVVRCSLLKDLTQACLFAVMAITHNYPIGRRPKLQIPEEALEDFRPPAPCSADGLLATYIASCDRMEISPHNSVLEYLMLTFAEKDNIFDFGEALTRAEKWGALDVQALCRPLTYNDTFTELVVVGPFDDDSLQAISQVFAQNKHIDSLIISHTRSGKQGFIALAEQLARGTHRLRHLTISNNSVGDSAIGQLCESLAKAPQVLSTFLLNECGISSKGIRHLTALLNESQWLSNLKALDISNNSIGKAGTAALAAWVEQARSLQVLSAVRCDLDTETLFAHLNRNKKSYLKRLNISENKLTKTAVEFVCEILSRTSTLTNWHLARTQLNRKTVSSLFEFATKNTTGVLFLLDLSYNDLGLSFAKKLSEMINDVNPCHSIGALILRETNLGIDGVVRVCEAAQAITRLRSVVFDSNAKATAFKNALPAGEALAQLINNHKSLRTISLVGHHDYCFKGALIPVFKALATNKTLLKLDVRHNKITPEAFAYLGLALKQNKFLRSLQIDDNRMDIKTLQDFAGAVQGNVHLVDPSVIPINDIGRLLSSNKKTKDTLTRLVHEMESRLLRNERFAGKAMDGLRDDEDFVYYESASENELSESSHNTAGGRSPMVGSNSSNKKGSSHASHHHNHVPHHHYTHLNFGHAQTQRAATNSSSDRSISPVSSSPPATMQHSSTSRANKRPPTSQTTFPRAATSPRNAKTPKKVTYAPNTNTAPRPHASSSSSSSTDGAQSRSKAETAQQIATLSSHAQVLGNGTTPGQRHRNGPPSHHGRGAQRAHHHRWYSRGRIMSYALGNMIDQMDDGPLDDQGDGEQAGSASDALASPSDPLGDILAGESDDEVAPPPVAPPSISPDEYRELKAAEEELHTPPPLVNAAVSPRTANGNGSAGFGFNSHDSNRGGPSSSGSASPGSGTPNSRSPSVPLRQGRSVRDRGGGGGTPRNVSVGNNPYTARASTSLGTPKQHAPGASVGGNNLMLPLSPKTVRDDVLKSAPVSPRYKKRASLKTLQPVRTGKKKSVFDHHRMNQHKSVPVPFDLVNSPPPTKYSAEELKSGVKFPVAIDLLHREIYLSDEEFKKVFGIDKLAFSEMQFPYQLQLKRRVGLF